MKEDFFDRKRSWSIYKDFILGCYLKPYISKVRLLRKPIAIIDCCAGPGKFRSDNIDGSPLIICKHLKEWREKYHTDIVGVFIEKSPLYYKELVENLKPYNAYAEPICGEFGNYINRIAQLSDKFTVFLYVDPFGVKDLIFDELVTIFNKVRNNNSVELLINFNCAGFLRWGLAVLNRTRELDKLRQELPADFWEGCEETCNIDDLNKVANGEYWKSIVEADIPFEEKEEQMIERYLAQFGCFNYVCNFPVKSKYKNVAKYHLIYGTRHKDGIVLMNDIMCRAREKFLQTEFRNGMLFDVRPPEEEKNYKEFEQIILNVVRKNQPIKRKEVKLLSMQEGIFCRYSDSDYNKAIKSLIKEKKLLKTKGKIDECSFYIKSN